jgi:hypothetical protein
MICAEPALDQCTDKKVQNEGQQKTRDDGSHQGIEWILHGFPLFPYSLKPYSLKPSENTQTLTLSSTKK